MDRDQESSLKILTRKALKTIRIDEDEDEEGDILQDRHGRVKVKPKVKGWKNRKQNPNPLLAEGKPLPKAMQKDFSDAVACTPLEEFDPFYRNQQTFVVIGKKKTIHRFTYSFSAKRVSFLLSPFSLLRRAAIYFLTHWIFSGIIVSTVVINCVLLLTGIERINQFFLWTEFDLSRLHVIFEFIFVSIYIFELCLKILARGVILDRFTCFRSIWNWLDLFIIAGSVASMWIYSPIWTSIQALRILKIIPLIPDLQDAFGLIVITGLRLSEMCLYALIPITGFSILAQKLFFSTLRSKCVQNNTVRSIRNLTRLTLFNSPSASCRNESFWYKNNDLEYAICGNYSGTRCPEGYSCQPNCGESPNNGQTSFDALPWTIFTIVRLLFQDYPQELYNQIWSAVGAWYTIFLVLVFFLGTFAIGVLAYGIIANSIIQKTRQDNLVLEIEEAGLAQSENPQSSQNSSKESYVHPIVEILLAGVVFLDITIFGLYAYNYHPEEGRIAIAVVYIVQAFCILIYNVEAIVKLIVFGPRNYFKQPWNIFDMSVVGISWIYYLTLYLKFSLYYLILESILQIRWLKLVARWATLGIMRDILLTSVKLFGSLFLFVQMFLFIFSIFTTTHLNPDYKDGFHLFPDETFPRWNFMDYGHSYMLSMRMLAGEWIETLRNCFLVANYSCLIYYIPGILIGHLLLMVACVSITCTAIAVLKSAELHPREKTALRKAIDWMLARSICVLIKSFTISQFPKHRELAEAQSYRPGVEDDWAPEGRTIDGISFTVILISWLPLVLDDIQNSNSSALFGVIFYTDIIFALYFVVEVAYKVYYKGPRVCLTSIGWLFDLLLVSGTFANLYLYQVNHLHFPLTETFNLRCLRIFMLVSRVFYLQVVGIGLLAQLRSCIWFILGGLLLWFIFATKAVLFLSWTFYKCVDPYDGSVLDYRLMTSDKMECMANNFTWINSRENFDNLKNSFLSLIQVGTINGFAGILEDASDASDILIQPQRDKNYVMNLLFIAFLIVCVFFFFNVLFGVILYHLQREKNAGIFMTKEQLRKYREHRKVINLSEPFNYPKPRYLLHIVYNCVCNWKFDVVIMLIICVDVVTFIFYKYQDAKHWSMLLRIIYLLVLALYTTELALKLLAWGKHYFRNFWNILDFCIVLYGIIDYMYGDSLPWRLYPTLPRIARILRFLQFQPLLRHCTALRNFMTSFVLIKSVLFNLLLFFVVCFASFATMGMGLFKNLQFEEGLNSFVNFQSFSGSILLLFQVSTFSGWNTILRGMHSEGNDCQRTCPIFGHCSNYSYGVAYIVSYLILSFTVIMYAYLMFLREFVEQLVEQEENDKLNRIKLEKEEEEKAALFAKKPPVVVPSSNCQPAFQEKPARCRQKKKQPVKETVKAEEFILESVPEEPEQIFPPEQEHFQLQRLSSSESHSIFSSREFLWNSNPKVGSSTSKIDMLDCRHKAKFNYEDLGRSAWSPEKVESIILSKDDSDPPVVILINSWQNDVLI